MDELTAIEIGKKYRGTQGVIRVKGEGVSFPVTFGDLIQSPDDNLFYFRMDRNINTRTKENVILGLGLTFSPRTIPLHKIEILPMPDRQVFDYSGITYVYSRYPNRQYQKGVCQGNTQVDSPVYRILQEALQQQTSSYEVMPYQPEKISLTMLFNLFEPVYPNSFGEALQEIQQFNLLSRTLNKDYFISLFPNEEKQYLLFRLNIPVAYYNKDKDVFTVIEKLYEQELKDFCHRQNLHSRIEV
jgi:hypothetical protein